MINPSNFWNNKRVLVTGHTGFKGSWLTLWLKKMGAQITGISLSPNTDPSLFDLASVNEDMDSHISDIRNLSELKAILLDSKPEIVFHLAAQPLVRDSYLDPLNTYSTNIMGTINLLESLRSIATAKVVVMITTDKVYKNYEWPYSYREIDILGGHDPYSASKSASEIVISSYRNAFMGKENIALSSARAGNVIGGGDWSKDRLIPDLIRAWESEAALTLRNPNSTRPWQHVLEPIYGYLVLATKTWDDPKLSGAYNFGPNPDEVATVEKIIGLARHSYGKGEIEYDTDENQPHEAGWLSLDNSKSKQVLGVTPKMSLDESIEKTITWYRSLENGMNAKDLCMSNILDYEKYFE